ncbi:hypothetical protein DOTSEDRAFT_36588 [Dothistroma septosporum NZE10]|uniref:Lysine-specific metallo-endopeptidase domain-containing protein n=1 Tax=Dothistroma septosporum (strain NZE10 / CBS 128990) TaxID=675120 RepID=N1PG97_DOTSN|nr:hypothetical protein DOTSEDRAFT_36588 [Dothistroma septosporum NZE10]
MKLAKLLRSLGLLATLSLTAASPIEGNEQIEALNNADFLKNVAKWNAGKNLASEVISLTDRISQDDYEYRGKLTKDDFTQLVERYFGRGSYPAVKSAIFPMFARMQEGLELGDQGPLKYRYDRGHEGFSGSAYTFDEVISFANQDLIHHPFVDKIHERARVWIHEMAHLTWVNGNNGGESGISHPPRTSKYPLKKKKPPLLTSPPPHLVHDIPTTSLTYSTPSLQHAATPLESIYGETLSQYLALCYPNLAPFSNDNIARFAMAVFHTAHKGHKPKPAEFKRICPAEQGEGPRFGSGLGSESVPTIRPEIEEGDLPETRWGGDVEEGEGEGDARLRLRGRLRL